MNKRFFQLKIFPGFIYFVCFFCFVFSFRAYSQSSGVVYLVTVPQTALFLAPEDSKRSATILQRGRRIEATGPAVNGFIPISIRSGAKAYVRASDVALESPVSELLEPVEPKANAGQRRRPPVSKERARFGLEKLTFDLGASGGSSNGVGYTEINLGLNAYFYDWLAWRNAVFGRLMSGATNVYGLDSSLRGIFDMSGPVGFTAFAGPGYRFVNQGSGAPFAEIGLVIKLPGFALGGGVKTVLTSLSQSGAANDTQYFLILAGGGSL